MLNDEASQVPHDELAWNQSLFAIQQGLPNVLGVCLDFSATPKDHNGMYFSWTAMDYPWAQAVEDRIIKDPLIVTMEDDPQQLTDYPDYVYRANVAGSTVTCFWLLCSVGRSTPRLTVSLARNLCSSQWRRRTSMQTF